MGKIEKGILGGFSGKVGPVIGASWRGIDLMRSRPKKSTRPASEGQEMQRLKFAMVMRFLKPVRLLLANYFGQPANEKSRENLATSYHIKEAVVGAYPDLEIDFQKVVLAKGELLGLEELETELQPGAILEVNWTDNSGQGQAKATDTVYVVVLNETKDQFEYRNNAVRSAGTFPVNLPNNWTGDTVHCWIFAASAEENSCSTSIYRGPLVLL